MYGRFELEQGGLNENIELIVYLRIAFVGVSTAQFQNGRFKNVKKIKLLTL